MPLSAVSIWETLVEWDRWLFVKINGTWTGSLADQVFPWIRDGKLWLPLYLFLFVFVLLNFRKRGGWWCLLFLSTVALADMAGQQLFKLQFERLRPCNDPEFSAQARLLLDRCGEGYSFISNHAANHFGMATFFHASFRSLFPRWSWVLFPWAALIAYAQVYVGIHYPLDVFVGALVGILAGLLSGAVFNKRFGFAIFDEESTSRS